MASLPATTGGKIDVAVTDAAVYAASVSDNAVYNVAVSDATRA